MNQVRNGKAFEYALAYGITKSLNGAEFIFDDEPIKRALDGIPLTEPDVLTFIRVSLERGIANVQSRQ